MLSAQSYEDKKQTDVTYFKNKDRGVSVLYKQSCNVVMQVEINLLNDLRFHGQLDVAVGISLDICDIPCFQ